MSSMMTLKLLLCVAGVFVVNIALNVDRAEAYQDLSLKQFCAQSELKSAFNQLMENKPQLYLMNGTQSGALIHQVWTDETLDDTSECTFTIESNLYAGQQRYGRGIYASIRRLNFRQTNDKCIDYVRFTFGAAKSERICGDFDGDSKLGYMSHFNDDDGIIKVHIFVNKSLPLASWNKRSLEIDLVFTAYDTCIGNNKFKCHPKEDHFCIDSQFKNDDIINCPPPFCSDEPSKKCGRLTTQPINTQSRGKGSASGLFVSFGAVAFVLVSILKQSLSITVFM